MQVAVAAFAETREAFGAEPIRHARLRAGVYAQPRPAEWRRHLQLGTQSGLRERDTEVVDQIVAVALEARIFLDVEHGDEIAARAVARPGHPLPPQRQGMMIRVAGRHVDLNRLFTFDAPIAPAAIAGAADHGAFAVAGGTRRDGEELAEERLCLAPPFPAPAAAGTPRHAEAIVGRALLGIAQHLVRFGDELELFFGRFVTVVAVGVALHGEPAVGLLDVGFTRVALHTEDDVEILLHAIRAPPRRAATCD